MNFNTRPQWDSLWLNIHLATLTGSQGLNEIKDGAIAVRDGCIAWVGKRVDLPEQHSAGSTYDGGGGWMTPGLIDSHTHLVYGGHRAHEFSQRLNGVSYEEIARSGGGILSTVGATRALDVEQLIQQAKPRLEALLSEGVTCLEIKSGYGLTLDDEVKMLRAAKQLVRGYPVRLRTTLLAAHTVPPKYEDNPDDYVDLVINELIPMVREEALADAVDVFCERIAFNLEQTERILVAARHAGLGVKLHAEQLSNSHGAELAARFGGWSADHLEYLDEAGTAAMKQAGTVATLLPGAYYFLGQGVKPPVALLRQAQVPMALASDLNPGSCPLASLRLMMNMSAVLFGLTPEEALMGTTCHAAKALRMEDEIGQLKTGYKADMLLWEIDDPAQLTYQFGSPQPRVRLFNGDIVDA